MPRTNRLSIVLLMLLALGVWDLLLRPFFSDYLPSAQVQVRKRYAIVAIDKEGKLSIGGDDTITLNATGLQWAVDEAPRRGWRIHSIACPQAGGYVVLAKVAFAYFVNPQHALKRPENPNSVLLEQNLENSLALRAA